MYAELENRNPFLDLVFCFEKSNSKIDYRNQNENRERMVQMKIKAKLQNVNPASFIHDYLQSCGIENPDAYIHAGIADLQPAASYINMTIYICRAGKLKSVFGFCILF